MASRLVYIPYPKAPFYEGVNVEFAWNGGFAKSQKQKNITAMHAAFARKMPQRKVLEISSSSMQEGGKELSAFSLKKYVPEIERSVPVECVFQGGKVFRLGGPYTDLYEVTPKEAKCDERLKSSGQLMGFRFDGTDFPLVPKTAFYDFLYINALLENPELAQMLLQYDAFTDIEFNPEKSLNCQAKAAAAFVSLTRRGDIERIKDPESFLKLYV